MDVVLSLRMLCCGRMSTNFLLSNWATWSRLCIMVSSVAAKSMSIWLLKLCLLVLLICLKWLRLSIRMMLLGCSEVRVVFSVCCLLYD